MNAQPKCPKCGKKMEEGCTLGRAEFPAYAYVTVWTSGVPKRGKNGLVDIDGKNVIETRTFRCSWCGYLESYAIKPN